MQHPFEKGSQVPVQVGGHNKGVHSHALKDTENVGPVKWILPGRQVKSGEREIWITITP